MSLSQLSSLIDAQGHSFLWLVIFSTAMFISMNFVGGLIAKVPVRAKAEPARITDMFYWLLAPVWRMVCRAVVAIVLVLVATALGREVSPALFQGFGPIARQPDWLLAIELLLLMDLSSYWVHRLFHRVPFLWRFHAIHHSATKIRWSTTARVHPVNEIFNYSVAVLPVFVFGFPIGMVLAMIPVLAWYAVAAHTDWNPSFGPLNRLFASPRFHRWHHTMSHEGGNMNFSNVFSLWDYIFGTYYLPEGRMPEVFGLDDEVMPENYWAQMMAPFRSRKPQAAQPVQPVKEPSVAAVPARDPATGPTDAGRDARPAALRSAS